MNCQRDYQAPTGTPVFTGAQSKQLVPFRPLRSTSVRSGKAGFAGDSANDAGRPLRSVSVSTATFADIPLTTKPFIAYRNCGI
jgi:hypothetical protein